MQRKNILFLIIKGGTTLKNVSICIYRYISQIPLNSYLFSNESTEFYI
jgi:hypothetical protein